MLRVSLFRDLIVASRTAFAYIPQLYCDLYAGMASPYAGKVWVSIYQSGSWILGSILLSNAGSEGVLLSEVCRSEQCHILVARLSH